MSKNVVLVAFAVQSQAFEAFAVLKDHAKTSSYTVEEAGVLRNNDDGDVIADTFGDDSAGGTMALGGLIGALVGVLGGPVGVLVGGGAGLIAGGVKGESRDDRDGSMISTVAGHLGQNKAGIVAVVKEDAPYGFDANFADYDVTITRWPAADVEVAVRAERELRAADHKAERKEEREERKEEREAKREAREERKEERKEEREGAHDAQHTDADPDGSSCSCSA